MESSQDSAPARRPQELLPWPDHLAIAAAVLGLLTVTWQSAERNSREALRLATLAYTPAVHITLPAVWVVGHRDVAAEGRAAYRA